MFWHNFKYALITLLKNKILIFWTLAFPIILGTFFYMAFKDIENNEKLDIIDIAIVNDNNFTKQEYLKNVFESLGDEKNEKRLFNIKYVNQKEAFSLLSENKIDGFIYVLDDLQVVVKSSGINETILKFVVDNLIQTEEIINNLVVNNESFLINKNIDMIAFNIYDEVLKLQMNYSIKDISNNNLSYTMIEYYNLIAMTCLYGGVLGMYAINRVLANMSNLGKRLAISSVSKAKLIISSMLSSYIIQIVGIIILFIYTIFCLNVDYGSNLFLIIILTLVGCFTGLSFGISISSIFKTNENTKIGVIIGLTMLGCFFSGMMGITMKYVIDTNVPIINKLNPANMITDGFYALYYYDSLNRYWFNLTSLLGLAIFLIILSIFSLRRQKYDSI